ncbi:MAG: glycosyltransferase family 2 protein [Patescibacteria group bacterium]
MEEAKRVALNVVTWNSQAYLPNLLSSLEQQDARDFMVTIVDNASTDGTVNWIQESHPGVAVLRNIRNQGFARAHNQAIAMVLSRWTEAELDKRYVLVSNPDLEFGPTSIRLLTAYMDAYPDVAACTPKLLRAFFKSADEDRRETEQTNVIDSTGLTITKARRVFDRGAGEEDKGQYDMKTDIFGCSGACVMFRASALVASKCAGEIFDEDIFAYKEDIDLAWRMRRLGYRASFVPEAVVWHHRRAASVPKANWLKMLSLRRTKSPFVNYLSTRNHGWVLIKNDEAVNALIHLVWWLPYEIAKSIGALFSWSSIKGEAASLGGIPKMLKKRAELAPRVKVQGADIRKWFV